MGLGLPSGPPGSLPYLRWQGNDNRTRPTPRRVLPRLAAVVRIIPRRSIQGKGGRDMTPNETAAVLAQAVRDMRASKCSIQSRAVVYAALAAYEEAAKAVPVRQDEFAMSIFDAREAERARADTGGAS